MYGRLPLENAIRYCHLHFKYKPLPHCIRAICDRLTYFELSEEALDQVVDEVRRRHYEDLSYYAYKEETGDESRNWLRYELWVRQKRREAAVEALRTAH